MSISIDRNFEAEDLQQLTSVVTNTFRDIEDQLNAQPQYYGKKTGKARTDAKRNDLEVFPEGKSIGFKFYKDDLTAIEAKFDPDFNNAVQGFIDDNISFLARLKELTISNAPPTTTNIPNNGEWGWHFDSAAAVYYIARNNSGIIITPGIAGFSGTISVTQHGNLSGAGATTMHSLTQINNLVFTSFSGSISAAQHGSQTEDSLHAAATTSVAGFLSATDKTTLNANTTLLTDITSGGTVTHFLNCTLLAVNGVTVVNSRKAAVTTVPTGGSADPSLNATAINSLINRLQAHGLTA